MRAARLYAPADIRVGREPIPTPGPEQSLVRITAVGICGSDLHWYSAAGIGDARLDRPLVVGHEFAGVVEGGPEHGKRVAVDPAEPCCRCDTCRTGWRNLCPAVRFAGHGGVDGALREFVAWPTALLHPLPDRLSDVDGAMLEPLGVALHAADLGHVAIGADVAVIGCGPIGLLLVRLARLAGASTVVAVDPLPHRLDAARCYGADRCLSPAEVAGTARPVGTAAVEWSRLVGSGMDVVFEVAGTDAAVDTALHAARPGGRVVLVGIPDEDRTTFTASVARRKGLTIALSRRMNDVYPRAIRLVERGLVDVSSLVTGLYPLDLTAAAFTAAAARTGLKVVVTPRREA